MFKLRRLIVSLHHAHEMARQGRGEGSHALVEVKQHFGVAAACHERLPAARRGRAGARRAGVFLPSAGGDHHEAVSRVCAHRCISGLVISVQRRQVVHLHNVLCRAQWSGQRS